MKIIIPRPIETDTRIYGIGIRQFVYLGVGLALSFLAALLVPTSSTIVRILVAFFLIAVAVALAFMKVNGHFVDGHLVNFLRYLRSPHTRVWNKEEEIVQFVYEPVEVGTPPPSKPKTIAFELRRDESIPASWAIAAVNLVVIAALGGMLYYMMYQGGFRDIQYWLRRGY